MSAPKRECCDTTAAEFHDEACESKPVTMPAGQIARTLRDGSARLVADPRRGLKWHKPKTHCTPLQWRPNTGMTRYEWARRHTPKEQRPFFEHLRRLYVMRPPRLLPKELVKEMLEVAQKGAALENGMPGGGLVQFAAEIEEYEISVKDPTGEWRFQICCEMWRDVICDRIGVSCMDYRTLPDWAMLVRLRSWVIEDNREAFIWMPDMDVERKNWKGRYENARFNNLQMISPRTVSSASQFPYDYLEDQDPYDRASDGEILIDEDGQGVEFDTETGELKKTIEPEETA